MNINQYKRNYRYKGANTGGEQKNFWIWVLLTVAICIAIVYFGQHR